MHSPQFIMIYFDRILRAFGFHDWVGFDNTYNYGYFTDYDKNNYFYSVGIIVHYYSPDKVHISRTLTRYKGNTEVTKFPILSIEFDENGLHPSEVFDTIKKILNQFPSQCKFRASEEQEKWLNMVN
jgi:hypothetical protein